MSELSNEKIAQAHSRGKSLYREFKARMDDLAKEGLVDCKMRVSVSEETTPADVVRQLNNFLRLRSEGHFKPLTNLDPYNLG